MGFHKRTAPTVPDSCECTNNDKLEFWKEKKPAAAVFKGKLSLSLCGDPDSILSSNKFLMSELYVQYCQTGTSIALFPYGGLFPEERYLVEKTSGKLIITTMIHLPAGKNWKWIKVPAYKKEIALTKDNFTEKNHLLDLKFPVIPGDSIRAVVKDYQENHNKKWSDGHEPEDWIGKLLLCALQGNEECAGLLKNMKNKIRLSDHDLAWHGEAMAIYEDFRKK